MCRKNKYEVDVDTAAPVELLKAQLYALTQVPPERQKIMGVKGAACSFSLSRFLSCLLAIAIAVFFSCAALQTLRTAPSARFFCSPFDVGMRLVAAGGTLKDDADLAALGLKPGQNIMLMGSAEVLADKPAEATVFAEDMPEVEVAALQTDNPGGLTNLGNTCYLNSTLQCMKAIPELVTSLQKFSGGPASVVPGGATDDSIVVETKEIINELLRSNAAKEVKPFKYVSTFRTAFPMFAQRTDNGQGFVQQDAEECWSTLLSALSQKMSLSVNGSDDVKLSPGAEPPLLPRMKALRKNVGDMLFGVEMESQYARLEGEGAEPPYSTHEAVRKIACHISEKTAHLYTALEVNLDEVIEKNSALLGREAQYSKKSKMARLPPCLAVQFVRFAWRKDTAKRAKILRQVSFPAVLDVRNLCTAKLQEAIAAHCTKLEEERDAASGGKKDIAKDAEKIAIPDGAPQPGAAGSSSDAMDVTDILKPKTPEELAELAKEADGAECGDNKTGRYELFAVITHQGRTAEGGHYVGWVKKDKKKWLVFDDETVAEIDADRVKELYGGGDWHMAYMCLYRKMDTLTLD